VPEVKIQPTRAQMLATAPESRAFIDLPVYSHFGYRYWRQLASGEVLVGGWRDTTLETEKTDEPEPTEDVQEHLERAARSLGARREITHRWAGTMGFTESGLPFAGALEGMPNVHICAGFTGHGMGFAFMTAKQVVERI
jgi:gamma-glutamylputrescine oxidase